MSTKQKVNEIYKEFTDEILLPILKKHPELSGV
jgi:hypothetical protein